MRIRQEIGEKTNVAATQVLLAELAVEENHPREGEEPARLAASEFRAEKNLDGEATAAAALANSLLEQRRAEAALKVIERASSLADKSQNLDTRFSVARVSDRIRAAVGERAQATQNLQITLGQTIKSGFMKHRFNARLALGEIEMSSGNVAAGRAHLRALEEEAKSKKFVLIADKAGAARH